MIDPKYIEQVRFLLRLLPAISRIPEFALHGGTAINLFHHNMPRLSVDIDLTFLPFTNRKSDLKKTRELLTGLANDLVKIIPGLRVEKSVYSESEYKLFCYLGRSIVKIEVNTIIRGVIAQPDRMILCKAAQNTFDFFVEMNVVPESQLFGGKIVAALDRQHPRDLFDIRILLNRNGLTNDIMTGFLFCLFNSSRPIHEILYPKFNDQRSALDNQFKGMAGDTFSYEMFEQERIRLWEAIHSALSETHKKMIVGFVSNKPEWPYGDWGSYPGIIWKLHNLHLLQLNNPGKFDEQIRLLKFS